MESVQCARGYGSSFYCQSVWKKLRSGCRGCLMGSPDAKRMVLPARGRNSESIEIPEVKWPIKRIRKQKFKMSSIACFAWFIIWLNFDMCPFWMSMYGGPYVLFTSFHPSTPWSLHIKSWGSMLVFKEWLEVLPVPNWHINMFELVVPCQLLSAQSGVFGPRKGRWARHLPFVRTSATPTMRLLVASGDCHSVMAANNRDIDLWHQAILQGISSGFTRSQELRQNAARLKHMNGVRQSYSLIESVYV